MRLVLVAQSLKFTDQTSKDAKTMVIIKRNTIFFCPITQKIRPIKLKCLDQKIVELQGSNRLMTAVVKIS